MQNAPVFVIDDDQEDLSIVQEVWQELNFDNPLEVFNGVDGLISRLQEKINPFLIICDVNLSKTDGFSLRGKLANDIDMSYKSIPFVFWSTAASNDQIKQAYDSGGHGFFIKGQTYKEITDSLRIIMTYWKTSKVPTLPGT